MGPELGLVLVILGVIVATLSTLGAGYWFLLEAKANPNQPTKYPYFVNLALFSVVPTLAVFVLTFYFLYSFLDIKDPGLNSGIAPFDVLALAFLTAVLLFVASRGDCARTTRKLPILLTLILALAFSFCVIESGRIARGKGYNKLGSAVVTEWNDQDGDDIVVSLQFPGDGRTCQVQLPLPCLSQDALVDDDEADATTVYNQVLHPNDETWFTKIQTKVYTFQRYNEYNYQTESNYPTQSEDHIVQYKGDVSCALPVLVAGDDDNAAEYDVVVDQILYNSKTCKAGWHTYESYRKEYVHETPFQALLILGMVVLASTAVFACQKFCRHQKDDDRTEALLMTAKPTGSKASKEASLV